MRKSQDKREWFQRSNVIKNYLHLFIYSERSLNNILKGKAYYYIQCFPCSDLNEQSMSPKLALKEWLINARTQGGLEKMRLHSCPFDKDASKSILRKKCKCHTFIKNYLCWIPLSWTHSSTFIGSKTYHPPVFNHNARRSRHFQHLNMPANLLKCTIERNWYVNWLS